MRLSSYLHSAQEVLALYSGDVPFAAWLKTYFSQHKKYGSKDRKFIADLCFCFFRLGTAFAEKTVEERLLIGQFLCHRSTVFVTELKPEWEEKVNATLEDKISFLAEPGTPAFFPFEDELSPEIDSALFQHSFLQQPDLFLRIRPGHEKKVLQKLTNAAVSFVQEGDCLRLSNSTKADELLIIDQEVVVQDKSSQQVLQPLLQQQVQGIATVWDCCAASGGKSILAVDQLHPKLLTVSDIRQSILINLQKRFARAGISNYRSFVADLSRPGLPKTSAAFDLVICDAPCSGSGTWARTPEQLTFFRREQIGHYTALQKSIAKNAAKQVKRGGYFLYITCSVFKKENEEVAAFLSQESGLKLLTQTYFKGYQQQADTLFAALFTT